MSKRSPKEKEDCPTGLPEKEKHPVPNGKEGGGSGILGSNGADLTATVHKNSRMLPSTAEASPNGEGCTATVHKGGGTRIEELLDRLPQGPGVYLMKDQRGRVIYVGKAANLRSRVRSYFGSRSDGRAFVGLLGRILGDIETIVTSNEKEAVLLEDTLIKQHKPRFNVKLRDDKNYLVIRVDPQAKYPRLELERRIRQDGARYFGPYYPARSARSTVHTVSKHFGLRVCSDRILASRRRPCLQFQIGACPAPCVYEVVDYGDRVRDAMLFLEGRSEELLERLRSRMEEAASALEFERAAKLRDTIREVETALSRQRVVMPDSVDRDVVGFFREGSIVEIALLRVRGGRLVAQQRYSLADQEFPDEEVLSSFINILYGREPCGASEILLPLPVEDRETLAEVLSERAGHPVTVLVPQRGPRRDLVRLANDNAKAFFATRRDQRADVEEAMKKLQLKLRLTRLPRRMECFDISTIQGVATVGSRVVFIDGEPAKAEYRRFQVRTVSGQADDYQSMYEVLSRRFTRAVGTQPGDPWALPDLLVVDGGKGQLSVALAAARDAGLRPGIDFDIIALAKERELNGTTRYRGRAPKVRAGSVGAGIETSRKRDRVEREYCERNENLREPADVPTADAPQGQGVCGFAPPGEEDGADAPTEVSGEKGMTIRQRGGEGMVSDRIFVPNVKDPIQLGSRSSELLLLVRLRNEAHRFAVVYHRKLRSRRMLRSALEEVPGIGKERVRALLRRFGSMQALAAATLEEIVKTPGLTRAAAEAVYEFARKMSARSEEGEGNTRNVWSRGEKHSNGG